VEVQLYSFCNLCASWELVGNATPWPPYLRERDPAPMVQQAGWAPGPVWACAEKPHPHRDSISDRPARSD